MRALMRALYMRAHMVVALGGAWSSQTTSELLSAWGHGGPLLAVALGKWCMEHPSDRNRGTHCVITRCDLGLCPPTCSGPTINVRGPGVGRYVIHSKQAAGKALASARR